MGYQKLPMGYGRVTMMCYCGMGVWEGGFMGLWYELWKDDCRTGHRRLEFMVCDCGMRYGRVTIWCVTVVWGMEDWLWYAVWNGDYMVCDCGMGVW